MAVAETEAAAATAQKATKPHPSVRRLGRSLAALGSWPVLLFCSCRVTGTKQAAPPCHPSATHWLPAEATTRPAPCPQTLWHPRQFAPLADLYISWQHNLLIECLASPQPPLRVDPSTTLPPAALTGRSSKHGSDSDFQLSLRIFQLVPFAAFCFAGPAGLILSATLCCAFRQLCLPRFSPLSTDFPCFSRCFCCSTR